VPDTSDRDRRRAREAEADREADEASAHADATDGSGSGDIFADDATTRYTDWISGAGAAKDAAENKRKQRLAESVWTRRFGGPDVDDLTADYVGEATSDEFGSLLGGPSEFSTEGGYTAAESGAADQRAAMDALRGMYETGGYTQADEMASRAMRDQQARQMGSANAAALQNMQARGMGGSGAELGMRMQAGEAMAGANAQTDASLQQAAMQRALQALQGYGAQSNAVAGADMQRRQALDSYNQSNTDWRRGREGRNTNWANESESSRVAAEQSRQEMDERAAAGLTGQYQAAQSNTRADRAMQDEGTGRGPNALGSGFSVMCCSPGTPVLTPYGERPISELREGDLVVTLFGGEPTARPLVRITETPVTSHEVVRVELANGERLEISPLHPTVDGRTFGDLRGGDDLGGVGVISAELVPYEHDRTHDILPDSESGAYCAAGAWIGSTLSAAKAVAA
jgi:hypothetical protein